MKPRSYLLVTVSRALHDTANACVWMRDTLESQIREIGYRTVFNGGAEKGDRDASLIAHRLGAWVYEYRTDGWSYTLDCGIYHQGRRWWAPQGSVHPLERNRFLARRCAEAHAVGLDVRVLGLVAPWSKTHGTDHTLAQASHNGIPDELITRIECPAEYGVAHAG